MRKIDLSIIIPCYNSNISWLAECLKSIDTSLDSFEGAAEVVVVDDGSEMPIEPRVKALLSPRVWKNLIFWRKPNGGLSSARNFGLSRSGGDWCHFIDDDDMVAPGFYQEVMRAASKESINLIFTESSYFGIKNDKFALPHSEIEKRMIIGNVVHVNGVVVSRKLLKKVGVFDETLNGLEDWDMWIRCIRGGGRIHVIHRNLARVRISPQSMSTNRSRMNSRMTELCMREWREYFGFWIINTESSTSFVKEWGLAGLSYALRSEAPLKNAYNFFHLIRKQVGTYKSFRWLVRQTIRHLLVPENSQHSFR